MTTGSPLYRRAGGADGAVPCPSGGAVASWPVASPALACVPAAAPVGVASARAALGAVGSGVRRFPTAALRAAGPRGGTSLDAGIDVGPDTGSDPVLRRHDRWTLGATEVATGAATGAPETRTGAPSARDSGAIVAPRPTGGTCPSAGGIAPRAARAVRRRRAAGSGPWVVGVSPDDGVPDDGVSDDGVPDDGAPGECQASTARRACARDVRGGESTAHVPARARGWRRPSDRPGPGRRLRRPVDGAAFGPGRRAGPMRGHLGGTGRRAATCDAGCGAGPRVLPRRAARAALTS